MALRVPIKINSKAQKLNKLLKLQTPSAQTSRKVSDRNALRPANNQGCKTLARELKTPAPAEVQAWSETDLVQKNMQRQHLQPSLLKNFYEPPVDNTAVHYPADDGSDANPSSSKYREFEPSTTYKSLTQPMKASKLANPFPEPVKVMESQTTSDREKADLMMAEAKQARQFQQHQQRLAQQTRKYYK